MIRRPRGGSREPARGSGYLTCGFLGIPPSEIFFPDFFAHTGRLFLAVAEIAKKARLLTAKIRQEMIRGELGKVGSERMQRRRH